MVCQLSSLCCTQWDSSVHLHTHCALCRRITRSPGVLVTPPLPPFCKPFFMQTTGSENDMIIWWVPSLRHSVTPPPPLKNPGYTPCCSCRLSHNCDTVCVIVVRHCKRLLAQNSPCFAKTVQWLRLVSIPSQVLCLAHFSKTWFIVSSVTGRWRMSFIPCELKSSFKYAIKNVWFI